MVSPEEDSAPASTPPGKPEGKPRKSPVSVRYPDHLETALEEHATATGKAKSQILIDALTAYLGLQVADTVGRTADPVRLEAIEQQLSALALRLEILEASGKFPKARSKPPSAPTAAAAEHLEAGDDIPAPQMEGLTARELSIRLGLNRSAVSNWWTGRKNPTPEQFTEWSRKQNDPDGQAWRRGTDDKYYPVP